MKKILSLLLALGILLALASCGDAPAAAAPVTEPSVTEGTTLPLYWPPIPEETTVPQTTETMYQPPEVTQPRDENLSQQEQGTEPAKPAVTEPKQTDPQPTDGPQDWEIIDTRPRETEPRETEAWETFPPETQAPSHSGSLDPNGTYDSKKDVALYIHLYGHLPNNYITKRQAEALGWSGGSVEKYAPGKCIGGDRFYNNEGLLPRGHTYYECDIDTLGARSRGSKRIVYSTDGLVYYTSNHYKSFTLLYGSP